MFRFLVSVCFLLPISAMAGKNTPHDPSKFSEYKSETYYELTNEIKYTERRGMGFRWEQGLKAGQYKARHQDASGYYFYGTGPVVCQGNPKCGDYLGGGGIWVSKKSKDDVRIFFIQKLTDEDRARNREFGVLINSLANKDDGKIYIFPYNKEFSGVITKLLSN